MPPGRLVGGTPTTDSAGVGVRLSLPGTSRATLVGDERNIVSNVDAVNSGDLILPLSVILRVDPMPKEAYDSNVRRITETEAGRRPLQIKATCSLQNGPVLPPLHPTLGHQMREGKMEGSQLL